MAMHCLSCEHPKRDGLDRALAAGISNAEVGRRYGLTPKAIGRHANNHLSPALGVVVETERTKALLGRVEDLVARTETILGVAEASGKAQLALSAVREMRESLKLLGQVTGELRPEGTTVQVLNVQTSDEWVAIRGVMLDALAPFPEARAAVAHALAGGDPQPIKVLQAGVITPYRPEEPHGDPYAPPGEDE